MSSSASDASSSHWVASRPAGRDRELTLLRKILASLHHGQGRLILIAGEAGIGKTALVDWFAGEARTTGARILSGQCHDVTQTPPYGPWRDALAGPNPAKGDARQRSPFATGAELATATSQSSLFERVVGMLASASARQPLVVALEDLHWADPASLELLRCVAQNIESVPLLLIATYRDDELTPGDALSALLPRLARESHAERIDLGALGSEAVHALVRRRYALSAGEEAQLAAHLQLRGEGNPLYIMELLRTLETGRLLRREADRWRLGDLEQTPVPPLIRQMIEERLRRLDPETQHLLEIAAVIGQEVPLEIWQEASGAGDGAIFAAAERAVAGRLAHESALPSRLLFTHALVRDSVYGRQPLLTRQARHRRVAEALMEHAAPASVVASHFTLAADPRAIDWLVRAGDDALALYAARDAIGALDRAQELATRHSRTLPAAVYRARATAAALLGEFDRARRDHELALQHGRASGDRHTEWQALLDLGMLWAERDYERTIGYYRMALALAREIGDPATLAYCLNRVANWHVNLDEPDIGMPLHEEALALFTSAGDRAGIADTLDFLAMTSYFDADLPRGTRYCEQAIALFRELGDRQRLSSSLAMLAATGGDVTWIAAPLFREPGYWLRAGEEGVAIARDIGWTAGEAFARICLSIITVSRGDLGRALREAEDGLTLARQIGHRQWVVAGQQSVAAVWIELLDSRRAIGELEQALTAARVSGSRFWTNTMIAMLASLHIAEGNLGYAAAMLGGVAHSGRRHLSMTQRQCRFAQAELLLAQGDPEGALGVVDELIATRANPSPDDRLPLLRRLRGDALARLGRAGDAEQAYLTARNDATILAYRPLLWRIEAALGGLYLAQSRLDEGTSALQRARAVIGEIAETIGDARSRQQFRERADARLPAPSSSAAGLPGETSLSPRELDVLRLLVDGKSDREIAAALFISPRTVMRHVTSILDKLGVSSRTAAATLAVRREFV